MQLTRGLRTRLSYASFKATNNLTHNTLHDLENDVQLQSRAAASRSGNYYNNPATQSSAATGGRPSGRKGPMGPPAPVTASATHSLFATLLAPPPAKRARTIHNPQDPPVPAPAKVQAPSPSRKASKPTRGAQSSPSKAKGKRSTREKSGAKGKGKQEEIHELEGRTADMDIDIQAAATLTSLLLSSRPSISAAASSPRSSISAGSDAGSSHSFPHFQQSSTRTVAPAASVRSEASINMSQQRSGTPASTADSTAHYDHMPSGSTHEEGRSTPKTGRRAMYASDHSGTPHPPTDAEAANSLLFLATSPSPARASVARDRESKDAAGLRALSSGSNLKGRVLFPTHSGGGGDDASSTNSRLLRREDTGSFTSTVSTTSSQFSLGSMTHMYNKYVHNRQMSGSPMNTSPNSGPSASSQPAVPKEPTVTPPTPTDPAASQLLPAPPSPTRTERSYASPPPASPEAHPESAPRTRGTSKLPADSTPGNGSFNFSDFINVSPSPAVGASSISRLGSATDVGRRLFEEHHASPGASQGGDASVSGAGLAAGIDLSRV